jgi:UPF0755 protein
MIKEVAEIEIPSIKRRNPFFAAFLLIFLLLLVLVTILISAAYTFNKPPSDFTSPTTVQIKEGTSVRDITEILEEMNVVRSNTFLYLLVTMLFEPTAIKASTYVFEEPLSSYKVAERLVLGDFDTNLLRITHIEGERVSYFADTADELLPDFNKDRFLLEATPLEGKLFPETYFVPEDFDDVELLNLLQTTFDSVISDYQTHINSSGFTTDEILVLASIIEREANTKESKRIVSGILQNRLRIGMPLQADASVEYILDKPLSELTPEDLKIDSPYNTYLNVGLPPTPIGNPGREAIEAVLYPENTDYYYYITDNEGVFHYAQTYNQHLVNIERYLR